MKLCDQLRILARVFPGSGAPIILDRPADDTAPEVMRLDQCREQGTPRIGNQLGVRYGWGGILKGRS